MIDDRDALLLAIAAAFHDAGFLKQLPKNEPIGANIAVEAMAKSGRFSLEERELVEQMILDTRFKRYHRDVVIDLQNMLPMTQALMERHDWQSPAGRRLFGAKKESNFVAR